VFFYVLFVLGRSVYCLCVNVYCTVLYCTVLYHCHQVTTQLQLINISYHKVWAVQKGLATSVNKNGNKGAKPKICLSGLAEHRAVLSTPLCSSCMQTLCAFS
jgi:hypothetical protein